VIGPLVLATTVHFSTPPGGAVAKVYTDTGNDRWQFVCATPCKAEAAPGTKLRIVLGDHDDESGEVVIANDLGNEIDVVARRGGRGAVALGIVLTSVGGLTFLIGALLAAVAKNDDSLKTGAYVCLFGGGGMTAGGIGLIAARTWEPSIRQEAHEGSRWATITPVPRPATFTLGFSF